MSSGDVYPPRPPSHDNSGKGTSGKKKRYVVRLLPPKDSLSSSTSSSSTVSLPIRSLDVVPTPSPPTSEGRPYPSPINGRGPSSVPTSKSSLSRTVANMPTNEDVPNFAMNDRPTITLINGAFHPSKVAANAVTLSIRQQFDNPWPTWGTIPKDHQELFFQRFKKKLVWRPEEEHEIKIAFNSKASHRLSEMFRDARNENKRPYWIGDRVWNDLLSHWNAPEYRSKCHQAKKNRAFKKGGCTHTGGFISLQQTHLPKDTGQFVDDRSRQTHKQFEARLSQARSDVASSVGESEMTPLDHAEEQRLKTRCWVAAAGPKHKGRLYGIGDLVHSYKYGDDTIMQHMQGSSSHAQDLAEINRLREELRQSKEEMRIFQSVVLQFLPPEARNIIHQHQQPEQQQSDQKQQDNDQPHDQSQQHND